jgi:hypothetical protein
MNEEPNRLGAASAADLEFLHGGAASSDHVPWQFSKFHAEMWVCGGLPAVPVIVLTGGFWHQTAARSAGIWGAMGPFVSRFLISRRSGSGAGA